jgi:diketogulonate reductase-like aldo/keto reductase
MAVKSYNKERMKQNLEIFDWSLTRDDHEKIDQVKSKFVPTMDQLYPLTFGMGKLNPCIRFNLLSYLLQK